MFGFKVKVTDETKAVKDAAEKTGYRTIGHALGSIRKAAIESIEKDDKPSEAGSPPHTRGKRKGFRRGILYAREGKDRGVVGTAYSKLGKSGEVHEHGGKRGKNTYQPRPFMGPAMERNLDRFAKGWAGSLGS